MKKEVSATIKKRKHFFFVLCAVLIFAVGVLGILQLGCTYSEKTWTYWRPDYEKEDIRYILNKAEMTETEYELVYRQTGLTRLAVEDMRHCEEGKNRILSIQKAFFTEYKIINRKFTLFTYMDEIDGYTFLATLKDGDIIVSASTRVSWWRYGHAAIVVDGENGVIAEALEPGTKSKTDSASTFTYAANFLVLRPKAADGVKTQIVDYVMTEMLGIPYRLTTGVFTKKYKETLTESHCAHFVWYAYKKFGIDLDSNGGGIVKPQDIALSDNVDVVQAYGFDLDKLWS